MKPWEKLFVDLYHKVTKGRRRVIVLPMIFVFFAIPALAGFVESYDKLIKWVTTNFSEQIIYLDLEEKEILDKEEWGLIIHSYSTREDALKARSEFKTVYFAAKHLNSDGQHIWQNDILVSRDPRIKGRWVLLIDMYTDHHASKERLESGVDEMIRSEERVGVRGEPLQRWLSAAKAYKFTKIEFEENWGKISEI